MTTEKSATEKLVDEISEELNKLYRAARGGRTPEKKPRDMVGDFIVRIGQAALSGEYPEMDEAFGVVGRGRADASSTVVPIRGTCYLEGHIETDDEEFMSRDITDLVDIPIIALRPGPPRARRTSEWKGKPGRSI